MIIDEQEKLPEGWRWVKLGEVCEFLSGGTPPKDKQEYWCGDIPWISPKDMPFRHLETSFQRTQFDILLPRLFILLLCLS